MNFAYGGTGVFDTLVAAPNKTKQIDLFEQLLKEKLYTKDGLKFSTALVSVSGNDYGIYLARGGSPQVSALLHAWTSISFIKIKLSTVIFSMACYLLDGIYFFNRGTHFKCTFQGLPAFIVSVVNQLGSDLQRIHDLGVPRVAIMGIQPLGCLPEFTMEYSYKKCNLTGNLAALFHNLLLTSMVEELKPESKFVVLLMYDAFISAMKKFENETGDFPIFM